MPNKILLTAAAAALLGFGTYGAAHGFWYQTPGQGQSFGHDGTVQVEVKIVSNPNRTFSIDAPPLTVVDCSAGAVSLVFNLTGSPQAKFPDDAGIGIKIIDGASEFDPPQRPEDRKITVLDKCTAMNEYKYDIGVVDPNGQLVILDPVIKNQ